MWRPFNAPITGVFFGVEIILRAFSVEAIFTGFGACLADHAAVNVVTAGDLPDGPAADGVIADDAEQPRFACRLGFRRRRRRQPVRLAGGSGPGEGEGGRGEGAAADCGEPPRADGADGDVDLQHYMITSLSELADVLPAT